MLESGIMTGNSSKVLVDATADINMYRRRGGFRTILSEYVMQNFLIRHLNKTRLGALADFILKSLILAAPAAFRGFIYRKYLRDEQ